MSLPTDEELLAYADELLSPEVASTIEQQLRAQSSLRKRLGDLLSARDQGNLSIGDLWRHHRLSCPEQTELGLFLLGGLEQDLQDYLQFHLQQVGCVYCQAQLDAMRATMQSHTLPQDKQRREALYSSSVGWLKK